MWLAKGTRKDADDESEEEELVSAIPSTVQFF